MDSRAYANSCCIRVGVSFGEFPFRSLSARCSYFWPHSVFVGGVGDFITNSSSQKAKLTEFDLNEFIGIFAQLFSLINF